MGLRKRFDAVIDGALGARIVGCVVLVSENRKPVYARAAGFLDREAATPMREDAIFRLASITKPIVASTALRMIDLGLLSLDDPVTAYLPWFTPKGPDGTIAPILIRHLLTHTSGLGYEGPDFDNPGISRGMSGPMITLEENLRRVADVPLNFAPGTAWMYGMNIDVLGGVLAAINGSRLSEVVSRYLAGPLGLTATRFTVADPGRLAVPYADGASEPSRMPEPHALPNGDGGQTIFSPKRILSPSAPQSGGSGMAGTARDVLTVLEAVRGDFLRPETRDAAFANQIGDIVRDKPGEKFGFLGAVIADSKASHWPNRGAIHWGGAWGHSWILDPEKKLTVVALTNTAFEGCNGRFRDEIRDAAYG